MNAKWTARFIAARDRAHSPRHERMSYARRPQRDPRLRSGVCLLRLVRSVYRSCFLCALLAGPPYAAAEPLPGSGPSNTIQPPRLVQAAEAVYPDLAKARGIEGSVTLELTIASDGRVTAAEVVEPAGHGFDEAARDAALRFVFEPARRDQQAIPARIRYRYDFVLPRPAAQPIAEPGSEGQDSDEQSRPRAVAVEPNTAASAAPDRAPIERAVDVTVAGERSAMQRLQESAEAVNVVDTRKARQETSDLGDVLARTQGVSVRRMGGLGSHTRFALNGLEDDQVPTFLDGVPLEVAGFPFQMANIPVMFVERVEIYRGVVPIRFGAHALGGALNLVTDQSHRPRLTTSYQVGSFGTHRFTLEGRHHDEKTGVVAAASGFFDVAQNNYEVDVEVPDERGRLHPETVPRFHDRYLARGASLEIGVIERPWAKRLTIKGFSTGYDQELQHNIVMTVPYGEARFGETVHGLSARYELELDENLNLELVGSYARRTIDFVDRSEWVYSWYGQRIRPRRVFGEIDSDPTDQTHWQDGLYGRGLVTWAISPKHTVRVVVSPMHTSRTGDERLQDDPTSRDPLSAERDQFTLTSGVEYEANSFDDRLASIVFVKDYFYSAQSEEPLPGRVFRDRDLRLHRQGAGASARYRFWPWLYAKVSYEYATRLPNPYEVFGNGMLILANLELEPEVSHNANLGPRLELRGSALGDVTVDINAFLRDTDRQIVLLGNDRFFAYQNVYRARSVGLENAANWLHPRRWAALGATLTWQDVRNASSEGTFGSFEGDRIPNRPWLLASWNARLRIPGVIDPSDTVEPFYNGRYVHGFFRGWESQGLRQFKQRVDAQITHNAGVAWTLRRDFAYLTSTFEIENLTDARLYDNFGVQRPGRGFFVRITGELH